MSIIERVTLLENARMQKVETVAKDAKRLNPKAPAKALNKPLPTSAVSEAAMAQAAEQGMQKGKRIIQGGKAAYDGFGRNMSAGNLMGSEMLNKAKEQVSTGRIPKGA